MKKISTALLIFIAFFGSGSLLAKDQLTFTASLMGEDFSGGFNRFSKDFKFDPANLNQSLLVLSVESGSFYSGDAERDELAVGGEWFASSRFPKVVVRGVVSDMTNGGKDSYQFTGSISMKGIEKPITFPLQIITQGSGFHYQGKASLNRLDFQVGTGEWEDTSTIGNEISIQFEFDS